MEKEETCCPRINPADWDGKDLEWNDKHFIRGKVKTFLFMPLNFGSVITKLMNQAEKSGAKIEDNLCLSYHTSKWNMDIYLAVDKEVAEADNINLDGHFVSKIYEGPFSDTGKWCKEYEAYLKSRALSMKKMYMWYTTCPKCAKKYGKNYVAIIAEV